MWIWLLRSLARHVSQTGHPQHQRNSHENRNGDQDDTGHPPQQTLSSTREDVVPQSQVESSVKKPREHSDRRGGTQLELFDFKAVIVEAPEQHDVLLVVSGAPPVGIEYIVLVRCR